MLKEEVTLHAMRCSWPVDRHPAYKTKLPVNRNIASFRRWKITQRVAGKDADEAIDSPSPRPPSAAIVKVCRDIGINASPMVLFTF